MNKADAEDSGLRKLKGRVDQGGAAWEVIEMGLDLSGGSLTLKAVGRLLISYGNLDTIHRTGAVTWRTALKGDSPVIWECALLDVTVNRCAIDINMWQDGKFTHSVIHMTILYKRPLSQFSLILWMCHIMCGPPWIIFWAYDLP